MTSDWMTEALHAARTEATRLGVMTTADGTVLLDDRIALAACPFARADERARVIAAVTRVLDDAEREPPSVVFADGVRLWSVWTDDVRKALEAL